MAHIGQELGLGPGGRFGFFLGLLKVLLGPLSLRYLGYAHGQQMIAIIKDHLLADEHQGDKKAEGGCDQGIIDLTEKLLFPDEEEEDGSNAQKRQIIGPAGPAALSDHIGLVAVQRNGICIAYGCQAHEQAATGPADIQQAAGDKSLILDPDQEYQVGEYHYRYAHGQKQDGALFSVVQLSKEEPHQGEEEQKVHEKVGEGYKEAQIQYHGAEKHGGYEQDPEHQGDGYGHYGRIQQELELLAVGEGLFRQEEYAQGKERIEKEITNISQGEEGIVLKHHLDGRPKNLAQGVKQKRCGKDYPGLFRSAFGALSSIEHGCSGKGAA